MIRIKERKEYGKVTGKDVGGCKSIRSDQGNAYGRKMIGRLDMMEDRGKRMNSRQRMCS